MKFPTTIGLPIKEKKENCIDFGFKSDSVSVTFLSANVYNFSQHYRYPNLSVSKNTQQQDIPFHQ